MYIFVCLCSCITQAQTAHIIFHIVLYADVFKSLETSIKFLHV